jgi:hypothetical protein
LIKEIKIPFKRRKNKLILTEVINDKEKKTIEKIIELQGLTLSLLSLIIAFKGLRPV